MSFSIRVLILNVRGNHNKLMLASLILSTGRP